MSTPLDIRAIAESEGVDVTTAFNIIQQARMAGYIVKCEPGTPLSTFRFVPPST